jgi:uncharacterized membrane protein YeaQ/YmgE (transglycosylase-associated protein family)
MPIIAFVVFGLVVGLIARSLIPGRQGVGVGATALLGIGGSFAGGSVGGILAGRSVLEFHAAGIVGSVLGAIAVLAMSGFAGRRALA